MLVCGFLDNTNGDNWGWSEQSTGSPPSISGKSLLWFSPSDTLPVLNYLRGMVSEASSSSLPCQFPSGQETSREPLWQPVWMPWRLSNYIYIQTAVIQYKLEGKAHKGENDLNF